MKSRVLQLVVSVLISSALHSSGAVFYVDLNCANPVAPYSDWSTAATTIQDAIDAASDGDQVLVTNGIYQAGGQVVFGSESNRVAVTKAVTVQSVNGPLVTIIQGYQSPGSALGYDTVRCVYLANNAALLGFTLTNGASFGPVDEPPYEQMEAGGVWCESSSAVVSNCVITGNAAVNGGGAQGGTLINCLLSGNHAAYGGGAYASVLINSALASNTADASGGGAVYSTLTNCTLTLNSGGGGGGVDSSDLYNCLVFFNTAPGGDNYTSSTFNFCCTTPLPGSGTNNLSGDPQLADAIHVSATSPCLGAGNADWLTGVDFDGEAWANPPAVGCDEFHAGVITGALGVSAQADFTNAAAGFTVNFSASVTGHASSNRWDFGDGTFTRNRLYASHSWAAAGDYPVVFTAYNDGNPGGVSATVTVHVVVQPLHYVSPGSLNPVPPFLSWATAATNIQDAVDAAFVGGTILVSNGVYQTGGRTAAGALSNRVAVTKSLALLSLNGPSVTLIEGFQVPGTLIGDGAVRCVFLTNGASLSGFTLTNGATLPVYYYTPAEQGGGGVYCAAPDVVVSNCVLTGNTAALDGGGAYSGVLNHCVFIGNSAARNGGGAEAGVLNHCLLQTNAAPAGGGGGADNSTLNNCILVGNSAGGGGGAYSSALNNCALVGNSTTGAGGGAQNCALVNCTLTSNSGAQGGGVYGGSLTNSIAYYNFSPNGSNYSGASFEASCTTPLPGDGMNNTSVEPLLADTFHLSAASPLRGAGEAAYATGLDIDGEPWLEPPSIGCDEYYAGAITGTLNVSAQAAYTNVSVGLGISVSSTIAGHASGNRWDFGDGTIVSNRQYTAHAWSAGGDYAVTFTAYNEDNPGGISATLVVHVRLSPLHYVRLDSQNPVAPYFTWATAATNIQDAMDAAFAGGTVVVSNGVYQVGARAVSGTETNRVAGGKPLGLQSVNGAAATVIDGGNIMRCVYLVNGSWLSGFTLANGMTTGDGGGLWCESVGVGVSNCVFNGNTAGGNGGGVSGGSLNHCKLTGNSAGGGGGASGASLYNCTIQANSSGFGGGIGGGTANNCLILTNYAWNSGGGAFVSTLNNCLVAGNVVGQYYGGGVNSSTVNNCTIVGNSAWRGGGSAFCTIYNCIIFYNQNRLFDYEKNDLLSHINYSCIEPYTEYPGTGNFASPPLFVNATNNFHLQSSSPCVDAGNNSYVVTTTDLDGNRRIAGANVDVGAYEYLPPDLAAFVQWLKNYGLPIDGSGDYADTDGDGLNNWQEWKTGTNPTNASSVLKLTSAVHTNNPAGLVVSWQSVTGITYFVQGSVNLGTPPAFQTLKANIPGRVDTTSYTDTNATGPGPFFYRVGVQ